MKRNKILVILSLILSLSFVGCLDKAASSPSDNTKANAESASSTKEKESGNNTTPSANDNTSNGNNQSNSNTSSNQSSSNTSGNQASSNNKGPSATSPQAQTATKVFVSDKIVAKSFPFYLGMPLADFRDTLKKNGIKETDEIEITSSPNDPEFGNKVITTSSYLVYSFDKNSKLYTIASDNNHDKATALGLKKGNTLETMEKFYGKKYEKIKLEKSTLYEYNLTNQYFRVFMDSATNKITSWEVSTMKFKTNK